MQLNFLKKNFSKNSDNIDNLKTMNDVLANPSAQIEKLLRYPGVKNILCNKYHNLNYDDVLNNGKIVFVCTRRGDLGHTAQQAFGLFFLLLMQQSVLSRPGTEKTRIPHFLYIDEFTPFISDATMDIFTLYRKYRVGTIISAQNLSQLGNKDNSYRQTILANSTTKVVFGNNTPEDNEWWSIEFGDKREWTWTNDYHTQDSKKGDELPGYDENYKSIKYAWKKNYEAGKIQALKFKQIIYKTKDLKGKNWVGKSKLDFLEARYKEPQKIKNYNFEKFIKGITQSSEKEEKNDKKFNINNIDFSSSSPNIDGPIARNPHRRFENNRTKENYINPIRSNNTTSNNKSNNNNNYDQDN